MMGDEADVRRLRDQLNAALVGGGDGGGEQCVRLLKELGKL